jgi:hypothetical protein
MDHEYLVIDGLRAGERVVVEGQQSVQPGIQVQPERWTPPPRLAPDGGAAALDGGRAERLDGGGAAAVDGGGAERLDEGGAAAVDGGGAERLDGGG